MEQWKDVVGFEGLYQVSDHGNIKSARTNRSIIGWRVKQGYHFVDLFKDCKRTKALVHRLVMAAFKGRSELEVDHVNGIKDDNRLVNLRYCTPRENITYYTSQQIKTSQYVGVCKVSNRFRSAICENGVQRVIGYFKDESEASKAYQNELNPIAARHTGRGL